MKRVFLCPGPSQLVTSVAAAACREASRGRDWRDDENYLVIDSLFTPGEESGRFAELIGDLADRLTTWESVTYLSPTVAEQLGSLRGKEGWERAAEALRRAIGLASADSVYACRNWMFTNELLLNSYASAAKICFGDGFGLYSPRPVAVPHSVSYSMQAVQQFRRIVRKVGARWGFYRARPTPLPPIEFDAGYFALLATPQGVCPPMESRQLERTWPCDVLAQLTDAVPAGVVRSLQETRPDRPLVFVLGENLSEAGEMSQHEEIAAWCELLRQHQVDPRSTLVYKPHPRDNLAKVERMARAFRDLACKVRVLGDECVARLPFELLFLAAFPDIASRQKVSVVTTGSTVISLKYYFDFDALFGWGPLLTEGGRFSHRFVEGNRGFEHFVREHGRSFAPIRPTSTRVAA